mgnify:FL=1
MQKDCENDKEIGLIFKRDDENKAPELELAVKWYELSDLDGFIIKLHNEFKAAVKIEGV